MTSLVWSPLKYAAPNDCQIRISSGGETKKIKVLGSEPNPSLAKSPNAQYTAVYAEIIRDYELSTGHRVHLAVWRLEAGDCGFHLTTDDSGA